jgi:hypothetical protein
MIPGLPVKEIDVVFNKIELNPTFNDKQVFFPVFATNYIVSDVTSGRAKILQDPYNAPVITEPMAHVTSPKRVIILFLMGLVTVALGIALFHNKVKKL